MTANFLSLAHRLAEQSLTGSTVGADAAAEPIARHSLTPKEGLDGSSGLPTFVLLDVSKTRCLTRKEARRI